MQFSFGGTRTGANPWGTRVLARELEANSQVFFMLSIIWACVASHTGFSIENPKCSVLWKVPQVAALLSLDFVSDLSLDMCAFGLRSPKGVEPIQFYKKPTRIVGTFLMGHHLCRHCPKTHAHGSLGRQEAFHLPCGTRVLKSQAAGVYPPAFCRAFVRALGSNRASC